MQLYNNIYTYIWNQNYARRLLLRYRYIACVRATLTKNDMPIQSGSLSQTADECSDPQRDFGSLLDKWASCSYLKCSRCCVSLSPLPLLYIAWLPACSSWRRTLPQHRPGSRYSGAERWHLCDPYWKNHDDVIEWKRSPRYWPFVRGIHRSPVGSPHKGPVRLWCFL